MTSVSVDTRDYERLWLRLDLWRTKAIPYAERTALTRSAWRARELWQGEIRDSMVLRNKWTEKSIRVDKARGLDLRMMEARVGSLAPYMETQEHGDTIRGTGKHGKAIPTSLAAGQAKGAQPRTRVVRRKHHLGAIRPTSRLKTGSRKQRNAATMQRAIKAGNDIVVLERDEGFGIFKLTGKKRIRAKLLWDISRGSVVIKPNPTMDRALDKLRPEEPAIHIKALREQLARHGLSTR